MTVKPGVAPLLLALSIAAAGASSAGAAEEKTVQASSAWAGDGRVFQVEEDQALFLGAFEGTLFVETAEGALDAAALVCPGSMTIKLSDRTQSGEGRCILTGRDGDRVFAEWRCSGVYLQGCRGDFRLTGGTGKFAGIAGQGDFVA